MMRTDVRRLRLQMPVERDSRRKLQPVVVDHLDRSVSLMEIVTQADRLRDSPRRASHSTTKLVADSDNFAVTDIHFKDFLAFHGAARLVRQFADDLVSHGVDGLTSRWPGNRAIDTEGDPSRLSSQLDTVD